MSPLATDEKGLLPGHQFLVRVWEVYFKKCPMVFLIEAGRKLPDLLPEDIKLDNSVRGIWEENPQWSCSNRSCSLPFEVQPEDGYTYRLQLEFEDCSMFRTMDLAYVATMRIHMEGKTELCAEKIIAALKETFAPIIISEKLSGWAEEEHDRPL